MTARWVRWLPAIALPAVVAVGVLVPVAADAAVDLPAKTPQQVLEMATSTSVDAFSGTVVQSADLGLPELPPIGPSTGSAPDVRGSDSDHAASITSALEFLTGTHTLRVYVDGPTKTRIQVMDSLAERDLVRNGSDAWFYDSTQNTATQVTLPQGSPTVPDGTMQTPARLADHFLSSVRPSTTMTVGENARVAGRPVYDLVLTPKSTATLVDSVSIGVDAETGLPLQVVVRARGQESPAFQVAFSDLALSAPAARLFEFTPPAGATVRQQSAPESWTAAGHPTVSSARPTVTGAGWDSVISLPAARGSAALRGNPVLGRMTTAVAGGQLLSTSLVNVFLSQDGRVFAGTVPLAVLQSVAAAQ